MRLSPIRRRQSWTAKNSVISQRKLELNASEVELNSKLSEAEVIFLNIKPLIKGLNKIKVEEQKGGVENE